MIRPTKSRAAGCDGKDVDVYGVCRAELMVGRRRYFEEFQVLRTMGKYDMLLGAKFLNDIGAMRKIQMMLADKIGYENTKMDF